LESVSVEQRGAREGTATTPLPRNEHRVVQFDFF